MITRYEVSGCLKHAEEDDFETGCQMGTGTEFDIAMNWSAPTWPALLAQLREFTNTEKDPDATEINAGDEPGRVDIQTTETDDGAEPTEAEYAEWKAGRLKLYAVTYTFIVQKVTRERVTLEDP